MIFLHLSRQIILFTSREFDFTLMQKPCNLTYNKGQHGICNSPEAVIWQIWGFCFNCTKSWMLAAPYLDIWCSCSKRLRFGVSFLVSNYLRNELLSNLTYCQCHESPWKAESNYINFATTPYPEIWGFCTQATIYIVNFWIMYVSLWS